MSYVGLNDVAWEKKAGKSNRSVYSIAWKCKSLEQNLQYIAIEQPEI